MKPKFTLRTSDAGNTLLVSGDLVVKHSEEFKGQLIALVASHDILGLSLEEVSSIDASALQLVYAFRQAAQISKKKVSLILGPAQEDMVTLLLRTGTYVFFKNN